MKKTLHLVLALIALSFPSAAAARGGTPSVRSGVIAYSSCNADEAFNESPECFKTAQGATLALYQDPNLEADSEISLGRDLANKVLSGQRSAPQSSDTEQIISSESGSGTAATERQG